MKSGIDAELYIAGSAWHSHAVDRKSGFSDVFRGFVIGSFLSRVVVLSNIVESNVMEHVPIQASSCGETKISSAHH